MITHKLKLAPEPFNAITSGNKTIESRLYDDKRQKIQIGGLLRYATFHDLFSHNDPRKFGGESIEWLENQMNGFYPLDEQLQNGVIGIEFVLI